MDHLSTKAAPPLMPRPSELFHSMPQSKTEMRRLPRVTLHPTSRVASVPVPQRGERHPVNYFRPSSVPRTVPNATPNSSEAAVTSNSKAYRNSDPVSSGQAEQPQHPSAMSMATMQAAYEKTEAHLKMIEEKLNRIHEEMTRVASPAAGPAVTASQETLLLPGSGLEPVSVNGAGAVGNKAAAHHHLQPIPRPVVVQLSPTPPVAPPKTVAKLPSLPQNPITAASPAPTGISPLAGTAVAVGFGIGEGHVLLSPENSSDSDSSSSSDEESSTGSGSTSRPVLAVVPPRETPAHLPPPSTETPMLKLLANSSPTSPHSLPASPPPAEHGSAANGTAANGTAQIRHGFGFKGAPLGATSPTATANAGGAGRRGIKICEESYGGSSPFTIGSLGTSFSSGMGAAGASAMDDKRVHRDGNGDAASHADQQKKSISFERIPATELTAAAAAAAAVVMVGSYVEGGMHTPVDLDGARPAEGLTKATRKKSIVADQMRARFFRPIPRFDDVLPHTQPGLYSKHDVESLLLPGAPCSWLCCAALAISYVSGVPTSVEKVLRANRMGVHYISLPAVTLAELYDVVGDYLHTCFHGTAAPAHGYSTDEFELDEEAGQYLNEEEIRELAHIHCEMATFELEVLDPETGDDIEGMGEHPPIANLAQFRKELLQHLGEGKSTYIFNYDPYVLEQDQLRLRSNLCDTEEEAAAVMATARYAPNGGGAFCILQSFDPVKHEVRLLTPFITAEQHPLRFADDEGEDIEEEEEEEEGPWHRVHAHHFASAFANLAMEENVVSLQAFHQSVRVVDRYSLLSRGYVRVFKNETYATRIPSMFPLFVLDGSSAGGLMTSVLNVKIATHLLGLAMLHHLAVTFIFSDSARRKQSSRNLLSKANVCDVKLRGIPLTKLCQMLRLPLSMIVCESNRSSIATIYVWYHIFLQQLQVGQEVRIGLVLPSRRDGAADGQPNISDSEFLEHLRLVVKSQSVMLISFDVNIAVNVRIDDRTEPAHFAIVIGVDEVKGIVRLADVNVKRFRKTWHIPISRLYNAVMGYGYIVASKVKKVIKSLDGKSFQDNVLQCARYALPPLASASYQRFEYPAQPYPLTVLADAVEQLGFSGTNVERFLNFCGFHITYFLSFDMPLEGAGFVIQNYSHYALDDAVSVTTTHFDYHEGNLPPMVAGVEATVAEKFRVWSEEDLVESITYALEEPSKRKLIVKYDMSTLKADVSVWNGSEGSSFAIVVDYDSATRSVVLSNANASSFYRIFTCPLTLLFHAICSRDNIDLRARGTLFLTTEVTQESVYEDTKGYDMAHALVHHPFKPIFSATCSCLALAATEMMMNIGTPQLLGNTALTFEEDEKRKYTRYNNIFSAEDILYSLPSFSIHDWRSKPVEISDVVSLANTAFTKLKLPLRAVDVLEGGAHDALTDPLQLLRACSGVSGLLTITLVAYDTSLIHGVVHTSVGLVNRVLVAGEDYDDDTKEEMGQTGTSGATTGTSVGVMQLLEGDPCIWGAYIECSAEKWLRAVRGIYRIEEVVEAEEEEAA